MNGLLQDLRFGFRMLVRSPGFTLISVLTLALGIGANSALFSVVHAVLLRSLPIPEVNRYVALYEANLVRGFTRGTVAPGNYLAWKARQTVFEDIAAYIERNVTLTGFETPELLEGARVSANAFQILRATPVVGRTFLVEEDRPESKHVAILSHALWRRRFNARADILGQTLVLDNSPYTIVGVMPAEFHFPKRTTEFWMPAAMDPERGMDGMSGRILQTIARLKPGTTLDQARAEMDVIAKQLAQANPAFNANVSVNIVPVREIMVGGLRPILLALLGAVGFVLFIGCANVANLLLARASGRARELAIRAALGARRSRIIRLLLVESLLLALFGGSLGLLLAVWSVDGLVALSPQGVLADWRIKVDTTAVGFTIALALATSLLFGLVPAWQGSGPDLNQALKEGSRGSSGAARVRVRSALVVAEVALSLVLLIGAGLMIRSFLNLTAQNTGFDPGNLLTFRVRLPEAGYSQGHQVSGFYDQIIQRLADLPRVEAVGATHAIPLGGFGGMRPFMIEGHPRPEPGKGPVVQYRIVSPGYFQTMRIPVLKGREFTQQDSGGAPGAIIINNSLANKYFPGEDPVGKRITIGGYDDAWGEIVGVAGDVRQWSMGAEPEPEMYWVYSQNWIARSPTLSALRRSLTLVVRTRANPESLIRDVRREVMTMDKTLPVTHVRTMEERVGESTSGQRFNALLITLFAALALVLASIGIYGVVSHTAAQRTREIGIRMALGARGSDVLSLVLTRGMGLVLIGVAIGLAVSLALTRFLERLLFGVEPTDPGTFVLVSLVLTAVALVACYVPARRAARLDPLTALRQE